MEMRSSKRFREVSEVLERWGWVAAAWSGTQRVSCSLIDA